MYTLDLCRICLSASVNKDIRDLKISENDNSESYVDMLIFCLDIHVVENSTFSTKLCGKCYEAILTYYKFKTLALRNDNYLKTIKQSTVKLEQVIKVEPESEPEIDDTNTELVIDFEVKDEFDYFKSDDYDLLSSKTTLTEVEKEQSPINEQSVQGACYKNELEWNMSNTSKKQPTQEDHMVFECCFATEEAPSLSKFSNINIIDTQDEHRMFEGPNTEETERNVTKTMNSEEKSYLNFDLMTFNSRDNNISLKAATGLVCNIPSYTTSKPINLKIHTKSHSAKRHHTGVKSYICDICYKIFAKKDNLQTHVRIHTAEKPFSCKVCDKRFVHKAVLNRHLRIHTGEKPYTCEICNKKFTNWSTCKDHVRTHTGEKPYACELCDKKFVLKGVLNRHLRIHTGEKPYACEICNKEFTDRSTCQKHVRTHTGEKPYACKICDMKFVNKSVFNGHLRIHTGEKPYACEICDKKFVLKEGLKMHIRTHTGEKPYACELCDKMFVSKGRLNNHMKIHTGEKPYVCDICGKRFALKEYLKYHIRIHTGEKLYACEICGKKFFLKAYLHKHIRTHTS